MPDTPHNSPDEALLGAALQMVDVWSRLSPEKQALLLKRFGTQENALAALVTTRMLDPKTPLIFILWREGLAPVGLCSRPPVR